MEFVKSVTSDALLAWDQPQTAFRALRTKSCTTEDAGPTAPPSALPRMASTPPALIAALLDTTKCQ